MASRGHMPLRQSRALRWAKYRRAVIHTQHGAAAAPTPPDWLPSVGSGTLRLRLDDASAFYQDSARTTLAVADGDPVGSWSDQGPDGKHAAQATSTKRFTLKTGANGINNLAALLTDGVDDCLQTAAISLTAYTAFLVVDLSVTGIVVEQSANAVANDGFYLHDTGGTLVTSRGGTRTEYSEASGWLGTDPALLTIRYDGTNAGHTLRKNRAAISFDTNGVTDDPGTGAASAVLNIGSRNNGASLPSTGLYGLVLVYDGALNDTDRDLIEVAAKARWATP